MEKAFSYGRTRLTSLDKLKKDITILTNQIHIVETIPFDVPVCLTLEVSVKGFLTPVTNRCVATLSSIYILLLANEEERIEFSCHYYAHEKKDLFAFSDAILLPLRHIKDYKVLNKNDLPLLMNWEVKSDTFHTLYESKEAL